jgi:hypothetical protein
MRSFWRTSSSSAKPAVLLPALFLGGMLLAQTASSPAPAAHPPGAPAAPNSKGGSATHTAPARKQYCQPNGGFCFKYPASWTMLGEIFKGNGVVVAPPQKQDRSLWNAITVALVVPPPEGDEDPTTLDGAVEQATAGLREAGQDFETLQRQARSVDHKPAQLLKVRYHDKASAVDWVEELVFIEGPDNEIYSVALKSSPADLARLETSFSALLASWTLPEPAPPPAEDDSAPAQPAPSPKTPQPAPQTTPQTTPNPSTP